MKNLYPKSKGKIHPSPGSPSGGGGGSADALAVLKLLPAAILALTVVLGAEDKEVLAYLITRSINGPASAVANAGEERRRCRRFPGGGHKAVLDCGCFECYTSFWSRWDCSPDQELIHHAIEAFEEHLATSERNGGAGGGKGRRRERNRSEKGKKGKEKAEKRIDDAEEKVAEESASAAAVFGESCSGEEKFVKEDLEVDGEEGGGDFFEFEHAEVAGNEIQQQQDAAAVMAGDRRRGWPDVMGLFNSRLWSLWSPGA